jgi:hypothetical protein
VEAGLRRGLGQNGGRQGRVLVVPHQAGGWLTPHATGQHHLHSRNIEYKACAR